jgi:hypothetical protein
MALRRDGYGASNTYGTNRNNDLMLRIVAQRLQIRRWTRRLLAASCRAAADGLWKSSEACSPGATQIRKIKPIGSAAKLAAIRPLREFGSLLPPPRC